MPSRVKPPGPPPDLLPSDSSPQPAPAKKSPAPQPPQPTPPSQRSTPPQPAAPASLAAPAAPAAEEDQREPEWPVAPPSVAENPPGSSSTSEVVPMTIGAELIELVRKNTGLSYELSRVAVGVVVAHLQTTLPQASPALEQVLVSLVESKVRFVFITWRGSSTLAPSQFKSRTPESFRVSAPAAFSSEGSSHRITHTSLDTSVTLFCFHCCQVEIVVEWVM